MITETAPLLTRQELADKLGCSYDFLYRNERSLGLDQCRVNINKRVVYYRVDLAIRAFVRVGLLIERSSIAVNRAV